MPSSRRHARRVQRDLHVLLSGPVNATIADGQGLGTITDDDRARPLGRRRDRHRGRRRHAQRHLHRHPHRRAGATVTVDYATANGTASAPADYTAAAGTLTFAPGQTTQTVTVQVNGDTARRGQRDLLPRTSTSPVNATIADGQGVGTITDDDPLPALSINDVTVTEGNSGHGHGDLHRHALDAPAAGR